MSKSACEWVNGERRWVIARRVREMMGERWAYRHGQTKQDQHSQHQEKLTGGLAQVSAFRLWRLHGYSLWNKCADVHLQLATGLGGSPPQRGSGTQRISGIQPAASSHIDSGEWRSQILSQNHQPGATLHWQQKNVRNNPRSPGTQYAGQPCLCWHPWTRRNTPRKRSKASSRNNWGSLKVPWRPSPSTGCIDWEASDRHFKHKELVKNRVRELRGTDFSVNDQFPKEILNRRRWLFPIRERFLGTGFRAVIAVDKLLTPWLYWTQSKPTWSGNTLKN